MKKLQTLTLLLSITLSSFAKTYNVYTANANGNFSDINGWSLAVRNDGVQKDKFIIPSSFTVTADDGVANMGLGDTEIQIFGSLVMGNNVVVVLNGNSRIEVIGTGSIVGNGNSQQIYIGGVIKYEGNKNKTITGLFYADNTTGISPSGFKALTLLPIRFLNCTASVNLNHKVDVRWTIANGDLINNFELEKSSNGHQWLKAALITKAANATGTEYNYSDINFSGSTSYYRIKQITVSGSFVYSPVMIASDTRKNQQSTVYGSKRSVIVDWKNDAKSTVLITVSDINGHIVAQQNFDGAAGKKILSVKRLATSNYVVVISDNKGFRESKQVFVD